MTLEQAIDRYTNNAEYERIHGSLQGCLDFRQLAEWLKDYKRLLEQEPCDDVVSRKKVEKITWDEPSYTDALNVLTEVRDKVRALPSVTRQAKTGHWIGHREHCENLGVMPSGLGAYEWCSNCDCGIDVREWHRNNYNYCPNCGAKMESEDKE